ncbi:hypothetical protein SISNIDRAFT_488625 [Sistotremastrum niveocremeum HHB9708]|uniref:Inactive metallocarboxypeptidase ECM14 n=1 Tax=Sistotremastrum niveocremeum HHB9708 TaxID=1314777 RepID=A0A164QYU0_9AGAM|nr:hypothetical protein SISNIDRAFT_488625 [Sistotremastrum niveocremeum HHB9708]
MKRAITTTALWAAFILMAESLKLPEQVVFTKTPTQGQGTVRRYTHELAQDVDELLRIAQDLNLDIWHHDSKQLDIYFPTTTTASMHPALHRNTSYFEPYSEVPSPQLLAQNAVGWNISDLRASTFHLSYHPLYEIDSFLEEMANEWPDLVELIDIGASAEGRKTLAVKIARTDLNKKGKRVKKFAYVIQGAQHAREWIATATALYFANTLVVQKPKSLSHHKLLDHFDFYIIPTPNPDGYEYTWTEDRFWYKNRQSLGSDERCFGLDLNRNWGYQWSEETDFAGKPPKKKLPKDKCSHWYPGSRPFEAPEVVNVATFVSSLKRKMAFLDLRSYGQMLSTPYSYSCHDLPADAEDLLEAAMGAAQAAKKLYGTSIQTGMLCEMLYPAPGNIIDWMYGSANVKFSFAAHLPDTGTYGFSLPPTWIKPVGEEVGKIIDYLAKFIVNQHPQV